MDRATLEKSSVSVERSVPFGFQINEGPKTETNNSSEWSMEDDNHVILLR